ncbi:Fur-regulated basic protein FbpA [Bacillus velezensis]|uniref:Fur-regulated basic protein FbpA n=1 Tax=Bacillus velezensis TaxID=492670 RepID=UPI0013642097|nr:Fur-regulated basic protein FbpA [Bacillus velezensis]QHK03920.1 Stress response protein YkoL [Bacillus velezensis]
MSRLLQNALDKERNHYSKKLLQIGVYTKEILNSMTITELRKEYAYFFRNIPYKERNPYTS